jgi:hypothetical protein
VVIAAGGSIASQSVPDHDPVHLVQYGDGGKAQDLQATKLVASIDRCRADGFCLASAAVGMAHSQENGARLGGTGRPLVRSVWGKSGAVGETGPFSERTVVLSASEATIAGREPSKDRFGNYSDPQSEICFGRDALCTI